MRGAMAVAVLILASATARAEGQYAGGAHYLSGDDLASRCSGQTGNGPTSDRHFCQGYVVGVVDLFVQQGQSGDCFVRGGVTMQQLVDIVLSWVDAHPARRHESAVVLSEEALTEAFSCQK